MTPFNHLVSQYERAKYQIKLGYHRLQRVTLNSIFYSLYFPLHRTIETNSSIFNIIS